MFLFHLFVVTLSVVTVHADLTCLEWALISPIVGLFCHFEPTPFEAVENNTVNAVEEAVQDVGDLVKFDLTHNPAVVTYNFIEQTAQGGLSQGGLYLENVTHDFRDVTIGFGKQSANQIVQIYELIYWNDISFCLIKGAGHLVSQAKRRKGKRAGVPSASDAATMARGCVSDKLKAITKPAVFTIDDPNQKIGSTISDIASLLIPVGAEEELAAEAAQGAVDLAVPGSEDTSRILKMGDNKAAEHFTNDAEAQAVADSMEDPNWVDENCGVCGSSPAPATISVEKRRRGSDSRLARRGNIMTTCCRAPASFSDSGSEFDSGEIDLTEDTTSQEEQAEVDDQLDNPIYDPATYNKITEADLLPAPQYTIRDISVAADAKAIQNDLDVLSTAVVTWEPTLTNLMSSDTLFTTLRGVFTGSEESPLYSLLKITERDGKLRMTSFSNSWISNPDPDLEPLQNFVNAAVQQGIEVVTKVQGLSENDAKFLNGNVEFFYTAPSEKALTGTDPRGFHTDGGMMQFGSADTPGLIISNTAQGSASRVPLVKNGFQLIKANFWDFEAWLADKPNGPTFHSVFGPEMAKEGRVSMVMSIFRRAVLTIPED